MGSSVDGGFVAAGAVAQTAGDPSNGGDADAGEVMNFPVWEIFLQILNHLPAIDQRLQLGRCTQVFKKTADFSGIAQGDQGSKQGVFCSLLLSSGFVSIRFHELYQCINALVR